MSKPTACAALTACLLLIAQPGDALASRPRPAATGPEADGGRILFELGLALPRGDLNDDFNATPYGFGAGEGLELGFQWRLPIARRLSLAPSFHYVNHRDLNGDNPLARDYRLQSSTLRYGVELAWGRRDHAVRLRPLLAAGVSLDRNRFIGFDKGFAAPLDESTNALGLMLRAGLRFDNLELSVAYQRNRFGSWRYFAVDEEQDAVWDTVTVRLGWELPLD